MTMTTYALKQVFYYVPIEMYQDGALTWMFVSMIVLAVLYILYRKQKRKLAPQDWHHHSCDQCGVEMSENEGIMIHDGVWVCGMECQSVLRCIKRKMSNI